MIFKAGDRVHLVNESPTGFQPNFLTSDAEYEISEIKLSSEPEGSLHTQLVKVKHVKSWFSGFWFDTEMTGKSREEIAKILEKDSEEIEANMKNVTDTVYLGDGAYVKFDGENVIMFTSDGVNEDNHVVLGKYEIEILEKYFTQLREKGADI